MVYHREPLLEIVMRRTFLHLGLIGLSLMAACSDSGTSGRSRIDASSVLPATESSQRFGDYTVHFNAVATDQISAEVALRNGIVRSRNRALLNVSVLRSEPGSPDAAVRADVSASATNLTGQLKNMTVREVTEGDAIYYVADVAVTNAETLIFTVDITPQGESDSHTLRFMKQFFVD
jgi:hypothetical protein